MTGGWGGRTAILLLAACLWGLPVVASEPPRARIATIDGTATLHVARTGYVALDGCSSSGANRFAWSSTVGRFYGHCQRKVGLYCKDDADCDWGDGDRCLDLQDQCRAYLREVPTRGRGRVGTVTLAINGAECSDPSRHPACERVDLSLPLRPPLPGVRVWSNLAQDYERLEDPVQPKWPAPATVVEYLRECSARGDDCHYLVGHNTPKNIAGQSEDFWRDFRPVLEEYWEAIARHNEVCGVDASCRVRPDGLLLDWRFDVLFRYDDVRGCSVPAVRQFADRNWKVCGAPLGSGVISTNDRYACPEGDHSCIDTWGYFEGITTRGGRDPVTRGGSLGPLGLFLPLRWVDGISGQWGAEAEICSDEGRARFGFGLDGAWHCGARRSAPRGRCFGGTAGGRECTLETLDACPGAGTCLEAAPAAYAKTWDGQIHVTAPAMLDWRHDEARRRYIDSLVYLLEQGVGLADPTRCLALSWQGYAYVFWDQGPDCGIDRVGCSNLADAANSRTGLVLGRPGFDGGSLYPNPYGPGESEHFARGRLLSELRQRLDAEGLCVTIVPNFAKGMTGILPRGWQATSWDLPDPARAATAGYHWTQRDTADARCRGGVRDGESCKSGAAECESGGGACHLVGSPFNRTAPRVVRAPESLLLPAGGEVDFTLDVIDDGHPRVFSSNESAGLRCDYDIVDNPVQGLKRIHARDALPAPEPASPIATVGAPPEPDAPCAGLEVEPGPRPCRGGTLRAPDGATGSCLLRIQASDHDSFARVDSGSRRLVPIRIRDGDGTPTASR